MSDLVRREDAIDAVSDCGICIQRIVDLPSAHQWIPCSEKLPETIQPVIVTWTNTNPASYYRHIIGKMFTGVGHFCNGKWYWYSSTSEAYLEDLGDCPSCKMHDAIEVTAWMPLPEAWKGEEDDEVTERTGRWTHVYDENEKLLFRNKWVCSACGKPNTYGMTDFCPCCGAMMENSTRRMKEAKE